MSKSNSTKLNNLGEGTIKIVSGKIETLDQNRTVKRSIRLYENFTTCGENYIGEKRIHTFDHVLRFNKNELNFEMPNGITYLKSFIL